ncbi:PTS sugar transporter subunit IIB [Muribacter muris]|uniref:PTS sugar transporter subunit IIB n=1 Tax=Muribacter muris TaxID=67855 RepID=A0A4Y9JWE0_9PAST|nr:PTS transporter subunit EIIB [Muribacter muris]MBF0785244.1 PTS transporter subunit EIIB [Muribacter muris]MBF0828394.1 PTS transporter subunit EIIB [Muribacter muris]TFV10071.1 PTS sugar transporter subunit IIB [Muribacter muris]
MAVINNILAALGHIENIQNVEACLTRLRVVLHNDRLLDKAALKKLGAVDVVKVGNMQQIIFGVKSAQYCDEIQALMA